MSTTPPGWYDDGHGALRWWDGASWTEHVHAPEADATAVSDAAAAPEGNAAEVPVTPAAAAPGPAVPAAPVYPAHYPGAPAAGGPAGATPTPGYPAGPPAPDAPRPKSKLWILWVVLGGVVLLMIVLAAILIPLAVNWFSPSSSSSSSSTPSPGSSSAGGADETRAVEAVELYDDAWDEADCDAYELSTTEAYRESISLTDCAAFETDARSFGESTDEYELEVTGVEVLGEDRIEVVTLETYQLLYDDAGELLDEPQPVEDTLRYVVVLDGDRWAIDALDYDE